MHACIDAGTLSHVKSRFQERREGVPPTAIRYRFVMGMTLQ